MTKRLCTLLILAAGFFGACRWGNDRTVVRATSKTASHEETVPALCRDLPADAMQSLVRAADGNILTDLFRDMTQSAGMNFTYRNGEEAGHLAILESLGGGIALIDFDGDGLLDIFITGGGYFTGPDKKRIEGHPNRLYKNLGDWKFRDVTHEVGLDQPLFYGHGAAVADYDRDGWPDLLVTGWGRMALYHNEPNGKGGRQFREVTHEAGLPDGLWTSSAAWGDLDGDGYPDLYVCQYVDWSFANHPQCRPAGSRAAADVCPPEFFKGLPHYIFHNNGNRTFTDVSKEAGLRPFTGDPAKDARPGKGLGVLMLDLNNEGRPSIYVANDGEGNFLYLNHSTPGRIRLEELGTTLGVARTDRGAATGSMGVDAADYNGSGRPSLWCTNFENEVHSLYRNAGPNQFIYSTEAAGVAVLSRHFVAFGTGFLDIDNHGWEDLVITNGHVRQHVDDGDPKQTPVLLRNDGKGRFVAITPQGGGYFRGSHLGRGLAIGDLDNDGRPDLVISHTNEPMALLRNEAATGCRWVGIELVGNDHRDVVGATVIVEAGGRRFTRYAKGGGSYLSCGDRRLLFGLGQVERLERVTVQWPGKRLQQWDGARLGLDRYWKLHEERLAPGS